MYLSSVVTNISSNMSKYSCNVTIKDKCSDIILAVICSTYLHHASSCCPASADPFQTEWQASPWPSLPGLRWDHFVALPFASASLHTIARICSMSRPVCISINNNNNNNNLTCKAPVCAKKTSVVLIKQSVNQSQLPK